MATLPISGPPSLELDGGNDIDPVASGFENAANLTSAMVGRAAGAGSDVVSKIGGNGRTTAKALAAVAAIGGGTNVAVEPALRAMGSESRLVQFVAGSEAPPKFTDRLSEPSTTESHVKMLAETGAAEVGDKNGQVPTRGR